MRHEDYACSSESGVIDSLIKYAENIEDYSNPCTKIHTDCYIVG